jgi:hypothetical protein
VEIQTNNSAVAHTELEEDAVDEDDHNGRVDCCNVDVSVVVAFKKNSNWLHRSNDIFENNNKEC